MIDIENRFFTPDIRNESLRHSFYSNVRDFEIEFVSFLDNVALITVSHLNEELLEPSEILFWASLSILQRIGYGEHDTGGIYDKFIESLREHTARQVDWDDGKEWCFEYNNHGVLRARVK